jgi:polysaccharide export outer membrane protein
MRTWLPSWLAVSLLVFSIFVGTAHAAATDTSYPIGAGDVLQVTIYAGGEEQESFSSVVSATGKISTPLLGEISIDGLLPSGVSQLLERRLAAGFYVNPQVIVSVKEYAGKVYVLGEVQRPGAYNVRDGLTALNACILAGGFSDYAALNRVRVIRQNNVYKMNLGKVRQGKNPDMVLRPGDRIEIPHRRF